MILRPLPDMFFMAGLPSSIAREASFPNCLSRLDGEGSDGRLMTPSGTRAMLKTYLDRLR